MGTSQALVVAGWRRSPTDHEAGYDAEEAARYRSICFLPGCKVIRAERREIYGELDDDGPAGGIEVDYEGLWLGLARGTTVEQAARIKSAPDEARRNFGVGQLSGIKRCSASLYTMISDGIAAFHGEEIGGGIRRIGTGGKVNKAVLFGC